MIGRCNPVFEADITKMAMHDVKRPADACGNKRPRHFFPRPKRQG
jgi:hypothetical protein